MYSFTGRDTAGLASELPLSSFLAFGLAFANALNKSDFSRLNEVAADLLGFFCVMDDSILASGAGLDAVLDVGLASVAPGFGTSPFVFCELCNDVFVVGASTGCRLAVLRFILY